MDALCFAPRPRGEVYSKVSVYFWKKKKRSLVPNLCRLGPHVCLQHYAYYSNRERGAERDGNASNLYPWPGYRHGAPFFVFAAFSFPFSFHVPVHRQTTELLSNSAHPAKNASTSPRGNISISPPTRRVLMMHQLFLLSSSPFGVHLKAALKVTKTLADTTWFPFTAGSSWRVLYAFKSSSISIQSSKYRTQLF